MRLKNVLIAVAILSLVVTTSAAQEKTENATEQRVPLSEAAVALDSQGQAVLEGTLRTTTLHGARDIPVTNVRLVIKNVSSRAYGYVSGVVTFYDGSGVRCGEGLLKADVLAINEAVETDTPGIRIRCAPATWRLVATNLLPRIAPGPVIFETAGAPGNMIISVDGEEHPIQLDRPMILNLGDRQRTIIVRRAP
ncbi:MAG TPA: hypothetical protein VFH15_05040 [Pyrinomonadaceae bacterium]|nr:hypothetical protein [Pyrinomonadaceae bacterium]